MAAGANADVAKENSTKSNKSTSNKSKSGTSTSKAKTTSKSSNTKTQKTTPKKTGSANKSGNVRLKTKKQQEIRKNEIRDDIIVLSTIACTVILLLSNFNLAGSVGGSIKWFMFGMFGVTEYIFPLVMFGVILLLLSNRELVAVARIKSVAVLGLMIQLSAMIVRISDKPLVKSTSVGEFFEYSAENKSGGGFIGGLVCKILSPLGMFGSIVIILLLAIVCIIFITEKSFVKGMANVSNKGSRMMHAAKQDYDIYREHSADRKKQRSEIEEESEEEYLLRRRQKTEEKIEKNKKKKEEKEKQKKEKIPRMDRKALGITKDLILSGENLSADSIDIHEISVDTNRDDAFSMDIYKPESYTAASEKTTSEKTTSEKTTSEKTASDKTDNEKLDELVNEQQDLSAIKIHGLSDEPVDFLSNLDEETGELLDYDNNSGYNPAENNDYNTSEDDELYKTSEIAENVEAIMKEDSLNTFNNAEQNDFSSENDEMNFSNNQNHKNKPVFSVSKDKFDEETIKRPYASEGEEPRQKVKNTDDEVKPDSTIVAAAKAELQPKKEYVFPSIELLNINKNAKNASQDMEKRATAMRLQQTLQNFGVKVTITDISCGPSVTRYELQPEQGVKVSKIVSLSDDIKLNLAAADIRIEAPIPGKAAIGIEVPNKEAGSVSLRELIETDTFKKNPSHIAFAAGKDIAGKTIVADIAKMPHLLIAGATGSGKSVCINTIIMSILYKANPEDVKLIMVDPKVVELSVYNGIPHLMIPVVTDCKKAAGALNWAVKEMTDRYELFAKTGVRDLKGFNAKVEKMDEDERTRYLPDGVPLCKMPQVVIIIDELADLMMVAPGEVEDAICRLAQLARAAGIHLVIATQRPSVNVITGLIKANVPSRIAFSVSSGVDSRTIIDMNGAEKLLGKGDMLFYPSGYPKPVRVQGAFVSDEEVSRVVDFLKEQVQNEIGYNEEVVKAISTVQTAAAKSAEEERDPYFAEAGRFVIGKEKGSIGMLQRYYKIGFNRAGRIMDQLEKVGVVGPELGTKPRKVEMTLDEFEEYLKNNN